MTGEFVTAGHLGGYFAGGDPDTMENAIWAYIVVAENIKTVIDVGCGDGAAMREFRVLGCRVFGIDGVPQQDPDIVTHDFCDGPYDAPACDLVWSAEFVEHVDAQYAQNFLSVFARANLVLMTHAVPGQGGHHHVNCQESSYWIKAMREYGYEIDMTLTLLLRSLARGPYFSATGLAFRRVEA